MIEIKKNVSLADFSVMKLGGPAKFFGEAHSSEDLSYFINWAVSNAIPFLIIGAGSNILISDEGFGGLVIKNSTRTVIIKENRVLAEAGASMARVTAESVKAGLSGFEWGVGIPGTIGGSVRGNAGCFGRETKDVLEYANVFDINRMRVRQIKNKNCDFSYRHSVFKNNPDLVVFSAVFKLGPGNPEKSRALIAEYSKKRTAEQDIGANCAGCVFKNTPWSRPDINKNILLQKFPELKQFANTLNIPSGFLIDRLGLKGTSIGGAKISEKHANFFVNDGSATSEDMLILMNIVSEKVRQHYGIILEEEIHKLL